VKRPGQKLEQFLENVFYSIFGLVMFVLGIGIPQYLTGKDLRKTSKTDSEITTKYVLIHFQIL